MPVLLPAPKYSLVSKRPSPFSSRKPTTPPVFPLPLCSATYKSPLAATTACRAVPNPSAATSAQNPSGSVNPALSGSQAYGMAACNARLVMQHAAATINPMNERFDVIPFLQAVWSITIATGCAVSYDQVV